ncbi:cytochrome c1 [Paroceanicella profunda]|uniref:Cytochrome c1 n=1 Tax=Paroceanicella profunda TaxID=2579971 RepID=A0A5B8FHE1_9RHOB|nr:cytochrome c1 [Paroceanicella profunda]QDL92097.1 cytochrome c1 [Paroceanicella profunda]
MIRKPLLTLLAAAGLALAALPGAAAEGGHIEDIDFSFEGPFGSFDQHQLQRGLQVYQEVCSACHGIRQVYFRNLGDPGGPQMSEEQVRAFTALYEVEDKETGDTRPATLSDHFPPNTGAGAPDLSLMAKSRAGFHGPAGTGINQLINGIGGPEYIHAILTGYTGEEKEEAGATFYENHAFPSGWIKMPPPLMDDAVTYIDGHPADVDHMAEDVAAFLMWTAEPKMMARKEAGMTAVIFLGAFAVLLYLTNKKIWARVKRKH